MMAIPAPLQSNHKTLMSAFARPLALTLGDPAGIGPELIARLVAKPENRARADLVIIGDKRELDHGMEIAQQRFDYRLVEIGRAHV